MTHPRLLVIVLNYRTAEMSLRAVEAALADLPEGGEILLVDNASGDGSVELFRQAFAARGWDRGGRVRLALSEHNGGFGAGNNIGLAATLSDGTRPDFFYLLNSDAFPDPGSIAALLRHLQITPKAGLVGSHIRGEDDLPHTTAFRFPSVLGELEGAARLGLVSKLLSRFQVAPELPEAAARVDWVAGASVMIRADMLDEIGAFDETFFLYFEETDLCLRAARAGWECWYLPQVGVVHIGSVSTGMKRWDRIPAFWLASRRHYFLKNHGRPYAALALLAHLTGGLIHRARAWIGGRPLQDPPHFLSDLARHGLGLPPARRKAPLRADEHLSEDRP